MSPWMTQKLSSITFLVVYDMLRLSVNLLSNVLSYLKEIKDIGSSASYKTVTFYHPYSVSTVSLSELASCCGWVDFTDEYTNITMRGEQILLQPGFGFTMQRLKLMLHDYVLKVRPIWANRILYGRKEAFIFMTKDEQACFLEAGLMDDEISWDVVEWWDGLSMELRKLNNEKMNAIGRRGEELTIRYEYERVGKKPVWISVDSNRTGYDLISHTDSSQSTQLLIEVKASTMPVSQADFHITRNEWQIAKTSSCYRFYVWCLAGNPSLAIITPEDMRYMIPIDQHSGEWETVKVPFSAFDNYFTVYCNKSMKEKPKVFG